MSRAKLLMVLTSIVKGLWNWLSNTDNWLPLLLNVGRLLVWLVVAAVMFSSGVGVYRFLHGSANFDWLYEADDMALGMAASVVIVTCFIAVNWLEIRHDWRRDMTLAAAISGACGSIVTAYGVFTLFFGSIWGLSKAEPVKFAAFGALLIASFAWTFGILPLFIKFALNEYSVETPDGHWARIKRGDTIRKLNGNSTDLLIDQIVEELEQEGQDAAEIVVQRADGSDGETEVTLVIHMHKKHAIHSVLGKIVSKLSLLKIPSAAIVAIVVVYLVHQGIGGNFAMELFDANDLFAKFISWLLIPLLLLVYGLSYPKNYKFGNALERLVFVLSVLLWVAFGSIVVRGLWLTYYSGINPAKVVWTTLFIGSYFAQITLFITATIFGLPAMINRSALIKANLIGVVIDDEQQDLHDEQDNREE